MLQGMREREERNAREIKQTVGVSEGAKAKVEGMEKALRRVQQTQMDTEAMNKRMVKMEHRYDIHLESLERKIEGFKELLNTNKTVFDNKLEQITHLDGKFQKLDKEMLKIRELIHSNRDKQAMEINDEMTRTTKLEILVQ